MTSPSESHGDRPPFRAESPKREFDALAELFLGDADDTPSVYPFPRDEQSMTPPPPLSMAQAATRAAARHEHIGANAAAHPFVEALLMAHLPVRSGPWALQYAAAVARHDHASVAMLRVSPSDDGVASRVSIDLLGAQPAWTGTRNPTFAEAMAHARGSAQRWVVLVGELDEAEVITMGGVDAITVLSGANEAAVVDAYRMLKAMTGQEGTDEAPRVRIAIMGADDERAEAAGRKLQHGARTFLNLDVELAPALGKMSPTGSTSLFRGSAPLGAEDLIALIRAHPAATQPVEAEHTTARVTSAVPAGFTEPKAVAPLTSFRLVNFVEGLRPLDVACPFAPEVQFATDARGRLHVLADGALAMQSLALAAAWGDAHRTLIAQATGAAPDPDPITQHVFAHDARAVRWLLDTATRIHLLTRAMVQGQAVTVAACPLN